MQCKDIPDEHVVDLARRWQECGRARHAEMVRWLHGGEQPANLAPGVVEALVAEGIPRKLAYAKVLSLCERKNGKPALLEYGTSPYYAWPA